MWRSWFQQLNPGLVFLLITAEVVLRLSFRIVRRLLDNAPFLASGFVAVFHKDKQRRDDAYRVLQLWPMRAGRRLFARRRLNRERGTEGPTQAPRDG
jgi:hypothetical protein